MLGFIVGWCVRELNHKKPVDNSALFAIKGKHAALNDIEAWLNVIDVSEQTTRVPYTRDQYEIAVRKRIADLRK